MNLATETLGVVVAQPVLQQRGAVDGKDKLMLPDATSITGVLT